VGATYWPEASDNLGEGCFRTADLAELTNGVVLLRGRAGEQINVAGRKVSPETIERELLANGDVRDCLVFGVPGADAGRGDLIVACVVPRAAKDPGVLKQFLLSRLPAWQVPKEWRFVESLEPNQRGKLSRAQWRVRLGYTAS
jgi:acyl-coenzyme A synthetase/AMP-(fatty) acid ligase